MVNYGSSAAGKTKPISGITRFCVGSQASGTGNYYNGLIDDFRIYNRVLSHGEIATLGGSESYVIPLSNASVNLKAKGVAGEETIDYRDFSVIADDWLNIHLWP